MLSTSQAAKQLGVSPRRIRALIESGDLQAERIGNSWAIDENSLNKRKRSPKLNGRPKHNEKDVTALKDYVLMNRNHEVARFTFNVKQERVLSVFPCADSAWAPLGACGRPGQINADFLQEWIKNRTIPEARPRIKEILSQAGFINPSELAFSSLGLSLSDQYWFKPVDPSANNPVNLDWHDINYFENGFEDTSGETQIVKTGSSSSFNRAPSNTTNGMLEKSWIAKEGKPYLIKGSSPGLGREPYCEVLASRLYARLLDKDEYVPYELMIHDNKAYSICPDMLNETQELVPAAEIVSYFSLQRERSLYEAYVQNVSELIGKDERQTIDKMIVYDFLMSNDDRHLFNFGLIREVESRQFIRVAPFYDQGCAFFARATIAQLRSSSFFYTSHPFAERPLAQLALAQDYQWFDPAKLSGFTDEVADVLSQVEDLSEEFIEHAVRHIDRNIDTVTEFATEALHAQQKIFVPEGLDGLFTTNEGISLLNPSE